MFVRGAKHSTTRDRIMLLLIACSLLFCCSRGVMCIVADDVANDIVTYSNITVADEAADSNGHHHQHDGHQQIVDTALNCAGGGYELLSDRLTTLTAYYPSTQGDRLDGNVYTDMAGMQLQSLQDFLENRTDCVTVAMDATVTARWPYGTRLCVPALNRYFVRLIVLELRDTDADLDGQHVGQLDICVRSETDSYEAAVNMQAVSVHVQRRH